ncbi:donson [Artemisia annua]|uniref:Donson n=1 Tax=Artemisia annua TaxID=35608 RepID=A0A2U1M463_ARTAN|nr:donson [Artemisia annua]
MDEFVSIRKNSNKRLRTLSGNANATENVSADTITSSSASTKVADEGEPRCSGSKELRDSIRSSIDDRSTQPSSTITKCGGNAFRSVTELSSGGKKLSGLSFDMDKAFKELAAAVPTNISAPAESLDGNTNPAAAKFCSEFHVTGQNIPLDFTLKTGMRVVSSSSVNWFHRLMNCGTFDGNIDTKPLYSWVYPQCSLPNSVITALMSSMKEEGQMDFLSKRQLAWETSFRSLYVMLRKNIANIFYVCTGQFVAMFTSGTGSMEDTGVCNAYISQSTRTLRSLLKEQDVCFTMPLCRSKVEQDTAEDLIELSEIERHSLGMSKRKSSVSDVDNSPESLLAFTGNKNVHGLYDFLLNYRFFLTSLTSYDVPLLYSPVPFENAALSAPEVKCKEVRSIDNLHVQLQESSTTSEPNQGSESTCSIKVRDAYLPPWIIRSVCDTLASNGGDFEASFTTEPMSVGLNVVIEMVCQRYDDKAATTDEGLHEKHSTFGITNTVLSPHLSYAFLNRIKFSDSSYTAHLSPV